MVDNLSEYSQIWGQAGFSAEEMFSILDNGLQSGAYNLDKVNDYVKEFTISLSDGRIAENIDSFSSGTKKLFESWQNGEATARDVFYSVISDLSDMENQQEALTLASNTWSSLGEDNAMKVITALDDVNAKYANVTGAAESLNEVKYDDIGTSLELLGKNVVEKVVNPIVDVAVPAIKDAVDMLNEAFEGIETSGVEDVTEEFKETSASIRELAAERKVTAENLQEEVTSIDTYAAKLIELQSIEERDGQYKLELVNIMKEMGNLIPEITAAYDTETHSLALSTEQIEAYAKARKNALTTDVELQNQENLTASIDATKEAISDLEIILAQYGPS